MPALLLFSLLVLVSLCRGTSASCATAPPPGPRFTTPISDSAGNVVSTIAVSGNTTYILGDASASVDGQPYAGGSKDILLQSMTYDPVTQRHVRDWTVLAGGDHDDTPAALAADPVTGDVYVAGFTAGYGVGTAVFSGMTAWSPSQTFRTDCILVKFARNGTIVWARLWGGSSSEFPNAIAFDAATQTVAVAGGTLSPTLTSADGRTQSLVGTQTDWFTVLYDSVSGAQRWLRMNGTAASEQASAVAINSYTGDVYTAGSFAGSGMSQHVQCVIKYANNGTRMWSKFFGNPNPQGLEDSLVIGMASAFNPGGTSTLYLAGRLTNASTYYDESWPLDLNEYHQNYVITAFDESGAYVSSRVNFDISINGIAVDPTCPGGLYLYGLSVASEYDAMIAQYDAAGVLVWSRLTSALYESQIEFVTHQGATFHPATQTLFTLTRRGQWGPLTTGDSASGMAGSARAYIVGINRCRE